MLTALSTVPGMIHRSGSHCEVSAAGEAVVLSYVAAGGSDLRPITPIWQELVIGSIAFAVLVFVLGKYVWPRMDATFQARREAIEGGLRSAEQTRHEAAELLEQAEQLLAEARTEAARIRDRARADAAAVGEESAARAREEADRIIHVGRDTLAAERGNIVPELRTGVGGLAVELAGRIAGESLVDEVRRRRTVDRFLNDRGPAVGKR
jgi:F-type H+-transporting ATPase subunit b